MQKKRSKVEYYLLLTLTSAVLLIAAFFFLTQFNGFSITGFAIGASPSEYNVYILNSFEGDDISFIIPIQNNGENSIKESYAEIEIFDSANNRVKTLKTNVLSLN